MNAHQRRKARRQLLRRVERESPDMLDLYIDCTIRELDAMERTARYMRRFDRPRPRHRKTCRCRTCEGLPF